MATVGSLIVNLSLNSAQFTTGMAQSARSMLTFDEASRRASATLATRFVSVGLAIGAARQAMRGLTDLMKDAALHGDTIGDAWDRIGQKVIESIPVTGAFFNLTQYITGELHREARALAEIKQLEADIAAAAKVRQQIVTMTAKLQKESANAERRVMLASATSDAARRDLETRFAILDAQQRYLDRLAAIQALETSAAQKRALQQEADLAFARERQAIALEHQRMLEAERAEQERLAEVEAERARLQAAMDAQREWDEVMRRAQQVIDETRTPLENYQKQLDNLNDLLQRGAIDWETYQRAIALAREELERITGIDRDAVTGSPRLIERRNTRGFRDASITAGRDPVRELIQQIIDGRREVLPLHRGILQNTEATARALRDSESTIVTIQ